MKTNLIIEELPRLYSQESFADVFFICKDKAKVGAHRLLLGAVSPLLRALFTEQPSNITEIFLPDFTSEHVDNLLRYLYEGIVRLDSAETYQFKSLLNHLNIKVPVIFSCIQEPHSVQMPDEEYTVCDSMLESSKTTINRPTSKLKSAAPAIANNDLTGDQRVNSISSKRKASSPLNCEPKRTKPLQDVSQVADNQCSDSQSLIQTESSTPPNEESASHSAKQPKLVPLKHFKAFVCKVEHRKAVRTVQKLVEESVQKQFARVEEIFKNITRPLQLDLKSKEKEIAGLKSSFQEIRSRSEKTTCVKTSEVASTVHHTKNVSVSSPNSNPKGEVVKALQLQNRRVLPSKRVLFKECRDGLVNLPSNVKEGKPIQQDSSQLQDQSPTMGGNHPKQTGDKTRHIRKVPMLPVLKTGPSYQAEVTSPDTSQGLALAPIQNITVSQADGNSTNHIRPSVSLSQTTSLARPVGNSKVVQPYQVILPPSQQHVTSVSAQPTNLTMATGNVPSQQKVSPIFVIIHQ